MKRWLRFAQVAALVLGGEAVNALAASLPSWAELATAALADPRYATSDIVVLLDDYDLTVGPTGHKGIHRQVLAARTERGAARLRFATGMTAFRHVDQFRAWTRSANGRVRSYDDDASWDVGMLTPAYEFDETRMLVFTPPHREAGMLLATEYEFRLDTQHPQAIFDIDDVDPVALWRMRVHSVGGWGARAMFGQLPDRPVEVVKGSASWEFQHRAALPPPTRRADPQPAMARLLLSFFKDGDIPPIGDWPAVVRWVRALFDRAAARKERFAALAKTLKSGDPLDAARHAARSVRYFANEMGWSGWVPHSAERTLELGMGDCKDKAILMAALLDTAGIEAVPVLISSPSSLFVDPALPTPLRFNHAIVGILWKDRPRTSAMTIVDAPGLGPLRLIDGTLPAEWSLDTHWSLQGAVGLPVDPRATDVFRVPDAVRADNRIETHCRWNVSDLEELEAQCERFYRGLLTAEIEVDLGQPLSAQQLRSQIYAETARHCGDRFQFEIQPQPDLVPGGYSLRYAYRCPEQLADFGSLRALRLPPLSALDTFRLPVLGENQSTMRMFLGEINDTYEVTLPSVGRPTALPTAVKQSIGSIEVTTTTNGPTITIKRQLTVDKRTIESTDREAILALRQALRQANQIAVVVPTSAQ